MRNLNLLIKKIAASVVAWSHDESGASAVEYGLMAGAIGGGLAAVIFFVGDAFVAELEAMGTVLNNASSSDLGS